MTTAFFVGSCDNSALLSCYDVLLWLHACLQVVVGSRWKSPESGQSAGEQQRFGWQRRCHSGSSSGREFVADPMQSHGRRAAAVRPAGRHVPHSTEQCRSVRTFHSVSSTWSVVWKHRAKISIIFLPDCSACCSTSKTGYQDSSPPVFLSV